MSEQMNFHTKVRDGALFKLCKAEKFTQHTMLFDRLFRDSAGKLSDVKINSTKTST
jgi:hypothetical protein